MKRYIRGYINNDVNLQIRVSVHSIGISIGVENSEIESSYKGGWESLEHAICLKGGRSLLLVVTGK